MKTSTLAFTLWLTAGTSSSVVAFTTTPVSKGRVAFSVKKPVPTIATGYMHPSSLTLSAASVADSNTLEQQDAFVDEITVENPLKVIIAGAGVGGLALAKVLTKNPLYQVTILEQTSEFKRFGGPIQLASNAMQILKEMDSGVFQQISEKFTVTGDKRNGIKDGIRTEWYAEFDLKSPAEVRGMPYTGVIDRPDLQEIYLKSLPPGTVKNGDAVDKYEILPNNRGVKAILESGKEVYGDVLIGADGIWSAVRATMRNKPKKGDESGATYSGYTVFAGELAYPSPDNGQVGYKVYIGPGQYFVITDIGKGNYQWYAFLARPPGSASQKHPEGTSIYLQGIFEGWSSEVHDILKATKEHEIEQRDLYDRPPSVFKPWTDGPVALLGDGVHAMMPNLGQGGCQAIEDAFVISQELAQATKRTQVADRLRTYQRRRLIRSAAVQGLSRFASDIIIRGFDTPAKIVRDPETGKISFENFNYAGIVTKMLQPILPIFFIVQFNFLYDGWRNDKSIDLPATLGFATLGGLILLLWIGIAAETTTLTAAFGVEAILGAEGLLDFEAITTAARELFTL